MVKGLLLTLLAVVVAIVAVVHAQQSTCGSLSNNSRYINLVGSWRETSSGKIWTSVQQGNHFTWTQQGTNRKATGFVGK